MTALAIDIGGTKVLLALVRDGQVLVSHRMATDITAGPGVLIDAIADAAEALPDGFDAVGAAVTGVILDGRWRALNRSILDLDDSHPLADMLADRFGTPARCVNDAQAAAWGEHVAGAGAGRDMAFLTISTGIGGGIIRDGRLLEGLAGSFGQFVDESGNRLEDRAAGRWIAREAAAHGRPGDAEAVFAATDEPWAEALVAASAARVAALCRNVQLAVDPDIIVIGGGIGLASGYLDRIRSALADVDEALRPRIVPAALGADAGIIGVAALAEDHGNNNRETEP
jgi:N-acetylmannosamine-6-phosphate 2-epimerase/N-acetylmannosamine kinase